MKEIKDGIINEELYSNSNVKILWVLKEPYSDVDNWTFQSYLSKSEIERKIGTKADTLKYSVFKRILCSSYGIINNIPFENIDIKNPNVYSIGEKIAYINIKKTPGGSFSYYKVIRDIYLKNKEKLITQILDINPDVLIFGNTMHYFKNDLEAVGLHFKKVSGDKQITYYKSDTGKIAINAYHPSVRPKHISEADYCNKIIVARELIEK